MIRKMLSLLLVLATTLSLTACGKGSGGSGPSEEIPAGHPAAEKALTTPDRAARFAAELLKGSHEGEANTLVSPLSVMAALAMAANGAKGETLAQMEQVMGMTSEELNAFFHSLMASLPQTEQCRIGLANSLWVNESRAGDVSGDFLRKNGDLLGAETFTMPFNTAAQDEINAWVNKNTNGMIPRILDDIKPDAVMYLINALAFEGEWEKAYTEEQVREGIFTAGSGEQKTVEFLHGTEYAYLNGGNAEGFIKYYKDRGFAFAALLPEEGVSLEEYVASLDGAALRKLLSEAEETEVITSIPKFEADFGTELSEILAEMGMPLAFDAARADFSGMNSAGETGFFISRVIHKTHICVDEKGTKAGAATLVEMNDTAALDPSEPRRVILDRPFVYLLVETENFTPLFIGCLNEIGG